MTFDLTSEQQALADRARAAAASIGDSVANAIDTLGSIAEDVSRLLKEQSLTDLFDKSAVSAAIALEEIAAVSAGLGAHVGLASALRGSDASTVVPMNLAGLRGNEKLLARVEVASVAVKAKARLAAAAVAIGIGRAAITHAIASMKKSSVKPGPDEYAPHWTFADGATEVAAARVLTYDAAQKLDRHEDAEAAVTRAHIFAANAAARAVDAAIKVEGPWGYAKGGLLERLSRDARTLQVILR
ncbi:MAG: acyl-CoA dehydrogenase family protein [Acidimicrobiia bacterium]